MEEEGPVACMFLYAAAERLDPLEGAWQFAEVPAGSALDFTAFGTLGWRDAPVPCTIAGLLRSFGELDEDRGNNLDERAFVFRRSFRHHDGQSNRSMLVLEGLATLAEVWLNGTHLVACRNMFRRYAAEADGLLRGENELVIHFRALQPELARKRPRGRWTTRLASHRNLRFVRTTLLGRMPGWAPPHPPLGPWRGVSLVETRRVRLDQISVQSRLEGSEGVVAVRLRGKTVFGEAPPVTLEIRIDDRCLSIPVRSQNAGGFDAVAEIRIPDARPWWCHDLGMPHRYAVSLALEFSDGPRDLATVMVGFRRIEQRPAADGGFALRINGRDVFCRGACWTPANPITLGDDPAEIRRVVGLVRDAGMNMLRLSGTMIYESDTFYEICDELGILVWQDFMFASMDYPEDEPEFAAEARIEAAQFLARAHHHPCLAVLCGNSEVEQQAAMKGLAPDAGGTPLFSSMFEELTHRWCPGIPYVPSSPTGGELPFYVDTGIAHYFGVGAYLRPPTDARDSRVRFASECLAFSNVPEDEGLDELFGEEARATHSPLYKRGVPRDTGAGWDFSDVTDHYLEQLFGCEARTVRYADGDRYLSLARVVPGVLMEQTFGVWRAADSVCSGGLLWFLRDLRPGSGWGVLDSAGRPKASYWFMKRACAPQSAWFTDEGLNGLRIHVRNDRPDRLEARLNVRLVRSDGVVVGAAGCDIRLDGARGRSLSTEALLGQFADATHAYRFGPCEHAIAVAELVGSRGENIATAHHLPGGLRHELQPDAGLRAVARPLEGGKYALRIESRNLALFVRISVAAFHPTENYFHLAPGDVRNIVLLPLGPARTLRGNVMALNSRASAGVTVDEEPA